MAVPEKVTVKNLSGMYTLNKSLSDSSQDMLSMQNVGWFVRQAIAWSNVEITVKQYTDEEGNLRIDTIQLSTGGMRNDEHWVIDGESREKESKIWGPVTASFKYVKLADVEDDYLKEGWEQACIDGEVLQCNQKSNSDTWTAVQIVGFAEVDGERRHVRRVVGQKGDQVKKIRVVYDWKADAPDGEPSAPA